MKIEEILSKIDEKEKNWYFGKIKEYNIYNETLNLYIRQTNDILKASDGKETEQTLKNKQIIEDLRQKKDTTLEKINTNISKWTKEIEDKKHRELLDANAKKISKATAMQFMFDSEIKELSAKIKHIEEEIKTADSEDLKKVKGLELNYYKSIKEKKVARKRKEKAIQLNYSEETKNYENIEKYYESQLENIKNQVEIVIAEISQKDEDFLGELDEIEKSIAKIELQIEETKKSGNTELEKANQDELIVKKNELNAKKFRKYKEIAKTFGLTKLQKQYESSEEYCTNIMIKTKEKEINKVLEKSKTGEIFNANIKTCDYNIKKIESLLSSRKNSKSSNRILFLEKQFFKIYKQIYILHERINTASECNLNLANEYSKIINYSYSKLDLICGEISKIVLANQKENSQIIEVNNNISALKKLYGKISPDDMKTQSIYDNYIETNKNLLDSLINQSIEDMLFSKELLLPKQQRFYIEDLNSPHLLERHVLSYGDFTLAPPDILYGVKVAMNTQLANSEKTNVDQELEESKLSL